MPTALVDKLQVAATSPLAFVAYVLLTAGWVYYVYAVHRIKAVSQGTKELKTPAQLKALRGILKRDLEMVPVAKRYQALVNQQRVFALVATLVALLVLAALLANAFTMTPAEIEKRLGRAMSGVDKGLQVYNTRLQQMKETMAKIDVARRQLQDKLDSKQRRNEAALAGVSRVEGMTSIVSEKSPEIEKVNQQLQDLVKMIREDYAEDLLPRDADVAMRLARATVANAERRYPDALRFLPEEIVKAETERAMGAAAEPDDIDRAYEASLARASALQGLARWDEAAGMSEQAEVLRPGNYKPSWIRAMCLFSLGRFAESVEIWGRVEPLVKDRMVDDLGAKADHAMLNHNRGLALGALGRNEDALRSFADARAEFKSLVEEGNRRDLLPNLVGSGWTYSNTLMLLGRFEDCVREIDPLIVMAEEAMNGNDVPEFREQIAALWMARAGALSQLGRMDEALKNATRSVDLQTRTVYQDAVRDAAPRLAMFLAARAVMLVTMSRMDDAIKDQTQALQILQRLVVEEERSEYLVMLGGVCDARGLSYAMTGRSDMAVADQSRAIEIYKGEFTRARSAQNEGFLAQGYMRRGISYTTLMKPALALDDLSKAIEIMETTVAPELDPVPRLLLQSGALAARARVRMMTQETQAAGEDFERAVAILQPVLSCSRDDITRNYCAALLSRALWFAGQGKRADAKRDAGRTLELLEPIAAKSSSDVWTAGMIQQASYIQKTIGAE